MAFLRRLCGGEALSRHGAEGRESTEQVNILLECCVFSKRLTDRDVSDVRRHDIECLDVLRSGIESSRTPRELT